MKIVTNKITIKPSIKATTKEITIHFITGIQIKLIKAIQVIVINVKTSKYLIKRTYLHTINKMLIKNQGMNNNLVMK